MRCSWSTWTRFEFSDYPRGALHNTQNSRNRADWLNSEYCEYTFSGFRFSKTTEQASRQPEDRMGDDSKPSPMAICTLIRSAESDFRFQVARSRTHYSQNWPPRGCRSVLSILSTIFWSRIGEHGLVDLERRRRRPSRSADDDRPLPDVSAASQLGEGPLNVLRFRELPAAMLMHVARGGEVRMGGRVAEGGGLLNRIRSKAVSGVRIPLSPPF